MKRNPTLMDYARLEPRLDHECNRALCRFLAPFKQEKTSSGGVRLLRFTHPVWRRPGYPDRPEHRRRFFLPLTRPKRIRPWFACPPDLREFYRHFDGLRESPPGRSGYFPPAGEVPRLEEHAPVRPELADLAKCPVIFCAANGDAVMLSEHDGLLWYPVETGIPDVAGGSFGELLHSWIKHHSVGDCRPFDSFGRG